MEKGFYSPYTLDVKSDAQAAGQYQSTVRNIMQLLSQRRVDEAVSACLAFSKSNPESNDALLMLGKARQMQGRYRGHVATARDRTWARSPERRLATSVRRGLPILRISRSSAGATREGRAKCSQQCGAAAKCCKVICGCRQIRRRAPLLPSRYQTGWQ